MLPVYLASVASRSKPDDMYPDARLLGIEHPNSPSRPATCEDCGALLLFIPTGDPGTAIDSQYCPRCEKWPLCHNIECEEANPPAEHAVMTTEHHEGVLLNCAACTRDAIESARPGDGPIFIWNLSTGAPR